MGRSLANFSGRVRRQNEVLPCFVTLVCRKSKAGYVSAAIHQCAFITVDALSDDALVCRKMTDPGWQADIF